MSIGLLNAFVPMRSALHVISLIEFSTLDLEFDSL
jgi:hypothetical protein